MIRPQGVPPAPPGQPRNGRAGAVGEAGAGGFGLAGRRQAELRLDAFFGRYAEILEAQLQALDGKAPDLERFQALAGERAELAREIDAAPRPLPDTPELRDLIARIRERVQRCRPTDAAVIRRLGELREETARALDGLEKGKPARSGYLVPGGEPKGGRRIDVKT